MRAKIKSGDFLLYFLLFVKKPVIIMYKSHKNFDKCPYVTESLRADLTAKSVWTFFMKYTVHVSQV